MVEFIPKRGGVGHLKEAEKEYYDVVLQLTNYFMGHLMAQAQHVGNDSIAPLLEAHLAASFNAIVNLTTAQEGEVRAHMEGQFKKAFLLYAEHLELQPGPSKGSH